MAKVNPEIASVKGKIGNDVFIKNRYGHHVRKAVEAGTKKDEPALKKQYNRTRFLNQLASEVNSIIWQNSDNLKSSKFYEQMQSRFRKQPLDNRLQLLMALKGMEINPAYPLAKLGDQVVTVSELKNKVHVTIEGRYHPRSGRHKANCYYYEVLLMTWNKSKGEVVHNKQTSDWINKRGVLPEFEFEFVKPPSANHWLLCLRKRLGVNEVEIEAFAADGMQIIDIGTFDEKERLLLEKQKANEKTKPSEKRVKKEVVRVKAKKRL